MAPVLIDRPEPALMRLRLNQPGRKNAMTPEMREMLREAIEAALADTSVRGLLLTGAGGNFCAGGDLRRLGELPADAMPALLARGHALVRLLLGAEKPVVVAIEGAAAGGGLALALCADLIVAADGSKLAFGFNRIGLVPDWGLFHTLPRRLGWAPARALLLQGGAFTGTAAQAMGLVDRSVPDGEAEAAALAILGRMAAQAPRAFALTKRVLRQAPHSLDEALEMEALAQASLFQGPEFREGVAAFLEKRAPRF